MRITMVLADLLADAKDYTLLKGNTEIEISDLVYDSRKVKKGCLFFCVVGSRMDSHNFIEEAVEKGAAAIVIERDIEILPDITIIRTSHSKKLLSYLSAAFFHYPARVLTTIAITGTKGKTTTKDMKSTGSPVTRFPESAMPRPASAKAATTTIA